MEISRIIQTLETQFHIEFTGINANGIYRDPFSTNNKPTDIVLNKVIKDFEVEKIDYLIFFFDGLPLELSDDYQHIATDIFIFFKIENSCVYCRSNTKNKSWKYCNKISDFNFDIETFENLIMPHYLPNFLLL